MSTAMQILASSVEGIDVKQVILLLFVLCVIGGVCWFVNSAPIHIFVKYLIYAVCAVVAVLMTWRFLQSL
jgi:hypothetical protein